MVPCCRSGQGLHCSSGCRHRCQSPSTDELSERECVFACMVEVWMADSSRCYSQPSRLWQPAPPLVYLFVSGEEPFLLSECCWAQLPLGSSHLPTYASCMTFTCAVLFCRWCWFRVCFDFGHATARASDDTVAFSFFGFRCVEKCAKPPAVVFLLHGDLVLRSRRRETTCFFEMCTNFEHCDSGFRPALKEHASARDRGL